MNRNFRALIVVACLIALPISAQAADIFMLVTGVAGDSTAKGHEKWIRVSSLDWKATAQSSWTASGGASVGKPFPDYMLLGLPSGAWSQHFMRLMGLGRAQQSVVIDAAMSDGRPLYRATLEGVFVTQYRLTSESATALPQDELKLIFKKVKIEYYAVAADGRVTSTFFEWDIPTAVVLPPI
jgi:type VI protein secretion system component Hcp